MSTQHRPTSPLIKHRLLPVAVMSAGVFIASGCGSRAIVEPSNEPLATAQRIKDWPANQTPPPVSAEDAGAWYNEYALPAEIHPLDTAQGAEPAPSGSTKAPPSTAGILEAIRHAVEQQRKDNSLWSLLLLEAVPEDARRGGAMEIHVDLGLTKLYTKCPEIVIENLNLEQAMERLCIKSGMRMAPTAKLNNPLVNWRKENASVYQAMQEIGKEHHFGVKMIGVGGRLTWRARDFSTRENFVKEVVNSIFAKGELMDRDVPTLVLYPARIPVQTGKPKDKPEEEKKPESDLKKFVPLPE